MPFVSESDVRRALTREEKIFIGRKTIITPSARDLANEHDVFVEIAGSAELSSKTGSTARNMRE